MKQKNDELDLQSLGGAVSCYRVMNELIPIKCAKKAVNKSYFYDASEIRTRYGWKYSKMRHITVNRMVKGVNYDYESQREGYKYYQSAIDIFDNIYESELSANVLTAEEIMKDATDNDMKQAKKRHAERVAKRFEKYRAVPMTRQSLRERLECSEFLNLNNEASFLIFGV